MMWDRAVTFEKDTDRIETHKILAMITNKMGADGFKISEIQGPHYDENGAEVWVLKVVAECRKEAPPLSPDGGALK